MVVKLSMQYCGQIFYDSFETYKTFPWYIITEFERKVDVQNHEFGCRRLKEVRSKISILLETTGGILFSVEGFQKMLFTIFTIPLEGFRYPSWGVIIPLEGFSYSS